MATIITTNKSNTNNYLTFLNTYPLNANSLNLNATEGDFYGDYTGTYWRPTDSNSYTPYAYNNGSSIELGFNVCWGDFDSENNKVSVRVSLMLSEYKYWLNVTNNLSNVYPTSTIRGFNYSFSVNNKNYNINSPIVEVKDNNNNKPDFTAEYDKDGKTIKKNFTFKIGNSSSNREYVPSHSTEIWYNIYQLTPIDGKAKLTINVKNLYLHWLDIYNGARPTIWLGNVSKTFYSNSIYSQNVSLSSNNINVKLNPKSATIKTYDINNQITSNRNFVIETTTNRTVINKMEASITSYVDTNTKHKLSVINEDDGTVIGNIAWNSSNRNSIKLSNYFGITTNAIYNASGNVASTTSITCKTTNPNNSLSCNVGFTKMNTVNYLSSNDSMATVDSTGKITAKSGRNGPYTIFAKFNGGLTVNTKFNSYLKPNGATITKVYKYGTKTQVTSANRGDKLTILANVSPYNANNSYISAYTGYRGLNITTNNTSLGNIISVTNDGTVYNATLLINSAYSNSASGLTITATSTNNSSAIGNKSITINAKQPNVYPDMSLVVTDINPNPVPDENYVVVTYDVVRNDAQTPWNEGTLEYLKSVSVTGTNSNTVANSSTYARANIVSASAAGITLTNPKRQLIYKVNGITSNTSLNTLNWSANAKFTYNGNYNTNNTATSLVTLYCNSLYEVNMHGVTLDPSKVITYAGGTFQTNLKYSRKEDTSPLLIDFPNDTIANITTYVINGTINSASNSGTAGEGYFKGVANSVGYTSLGVVSQQEPYSANCDIYVVDKIIPSIIFPYIYIKKSDGISNYYYDAINYNNQELVRLIFKLPPSYIMECVNDILITVRYLENNTKKDITYSLSGNPELFSLSYLSNSLGRTFTMTDLLSIMAEYETYYSDQPYCVFQENIDNRNIGTQIEYIDLKLSFDSNYIQQNIQSLDELESMNSDIVSVRIKANYDNNLEDIKPLDPITLDRMEYFVKAYKSIVSGYVKYAPELVNDYGKQICSMENLGEKDKPITVAPFYNLLLSQNYIKSLDRYILRRYFDMTNKVLKLNLTSQIMEDKFYPSFIRNMLADNHMCMNYDIYSANKLLSIPNSGTNLYQPTKPNLSIMQEYMMADDSNDFIYNDTNRLNTYKDSSFYSNYTISPLKEFTKSFYINRLSLQSSYTFTTPEPPSQETTLLPIMNDIVAIYDINSWDSTGTTSWINKLSYDDSYKYNIKFGYMGGILPAPYTLYDDVNKEIRTIYTSQSGFNSVPTYGLINLNRLTNYTIYIVARLKTSGTNIVNDSTYISTMSYDNSNNKFTGWSIGNYTDIEYTSSKPRNLAFNNLDNNRIYLCNGTNSVREYIIGSLNTYRVYTISVKTNSNGSNVIKLFINGTYYRSITNINGIWNDNYNTYLVLNGIYCYNTNNTKIITSSSINYYRYLAIANTNQDNTTISRNSKYIAQKFISDIPYTP